MKHLLTILMMLGMFAMTGCGDSGPSQTAKNFFRAIEKGDAKTVKELAPGFGMMGDDKLEGFVKQAAMQIKKEGGIKEIKITDEKIDGDKATLTATVISESGKGDAEPTPMELVKIDGKWTIDMGNESKNKPGGMKMTPNINMPMNPDEMTISPEAIAPAKPASPPAP